MGDEPGSRREPGTRIGRTALADVAAEAGVSTSTVSHALNGTRAVRAETRERVVRAAERLGYSRNRVARRQPKRRTTVVGLVIDCIATTPFAGRIIRGAQEAAREHGAHLTVVDCGGDPEVEDVHVRSLADRGVDGILIAGGSHREIERPGAIGDLPVVLVDAVPAPGWDVPAVAPDEHGIAATAIAHLLAAGHRRLAFITSSEDTPATRGRHAGFRSAVEWAGLYDRHAPVERASPDAAGGRRMGRRLLDHPTGDRPTAILCFNDQMAMGVYQAAEALGLEVPRDCSVVGVDDLEIVAAGLDPGLTTVALPHREMGRWGMSALLERIAGRAVDATGPVLLAGELVERRSVGPPRRLLGWFNRG
ncbi:LacI family transcriptional regulator [Agromyces sp. SYSU K20354]|uniref:LacI family DNA-binding transcriptional regulator n=1 Tax=Agromyces cavernae TaxID=2898659 RepID=UPI001E5B7929|nr:LacI family DNA-binding transcriptional regulator [Agromyces cavernae]MCD2440739.1 LacI family transcriptional regulator [Agromyces cavernae]